MVLTLLLHRKMFEVSNLLFALFVTHRFRDGLFHTLCVEVFHIVFEMEVSRVYADAVTERPDAYSNYMEYAVKYG